MELKINHLNEDPDFSRLLNDFDIFEQTFLSPYSVNPNALDDKKSVQVYHSDHNNAEAIAMVDEMMKIENVHEYHKEDDQCDATANSVVATTCDGVNGSNNNEEVELDFLQGDPKFLEHLDEVLNTGVTVVAQEGEAGCGGGDSTLRNENELIDFEKYLEKVLVEETATQELIHNATDQTEAVSKISNTGCENNVQVYHSDHNNAESMVDKMMNIKNVHDYHKEDDQCDATAKSVVATACDGVNGSNNNEELEYREEVLNTSGTVVTQEGEAEYGGGDSTLINENELIDFEKYLEKVLVGESATQELIHNATDQTEAVSKINNTGCENNVKRWKTRKRLKKGTPEFAQRREMYKLMNRVAAAKSFERKKAYIEQLELQVQKLRLEIAFRKNWLLFLRTANKNYRTRGGPSELRRTISASIFL